MRNKIKFIFLITLAFAFIGGIISWKISFDEVAHVRVLLPTFNGQNDLNPTIPLSEILWIKKYFEEEKILQKICSLENFESKLNELKPLHLGGRGRLQIKPIPGSYIVDISILGKPREYIQSVANTASSMIIREYQQKNAVLLDRIYLRKNSAEAAINYIEFQKKEITDFIKNKPKNPHDNSILDRVIMEKTFSSYDLEKIFYLKYLESSEKEIELISTTQPVGLGSAYIEASFPLSRNGLILLGSACGMLFGLIIVLLDSGRAEKKNS